MELLYCPVCGATHMNRVNGVWWKWRCIWCNQVFAIVPISALTQGINVLSLTPVAEPTELFEALHEDDCANEKGVRNESLTA